jgi:hypothetical protein
MGHGVGLKTLYELRVEFPHGETTHQVTIKKGDLMVTMFRVGSTCRTCRMVAMGDTFHLPPHEEGSRFIWRPEFQFTWDGCEVETTEGAMVSTEVLDWDVIAS